MLTANRIAMSSISLAKIVRGSSLNLTIYMMLAINPNV